MQRSADYLRLLIALLGLALSPLVTAEQAVNHIVLVWLKPDTQPTTYQQILEASKALGAIGQIQELRIGKSIPSERPIVDDSFSFGLYMRFETVEAMNAYLTDPRHVQFVDTLVKPNLEKLVIYDF
ncbi:MAG TPA: Dabb family protein [Gammaproteobacteria bacterium]